MAYIPVGLELDGAQVRISVWDGQKCAHIAGISELPALIGLVNGQLVWALEAQKLHLNDPDAVLTLEECLDGKVLMGNGVLFTSKRLLRAYWATLLRALEERLEAPCSIECIAVTASLPHTQRTLLMETIAEANRNERRRPRVVDSISCVAYQYQFVMHHEDRLLLFCSLANDGARLSLVNMDGEYVEVISTREIPALDVQNIQAELADLCLTLADKPRYMLPRLMQQMRYQFGALKAVDTIALYLGDRPVEVSRRDVLECIGKRAQMLRETVAQLYAEAQVSPDAVDRVLLSGALTELPGVEDVLTPVFGCLPTVLENSHRAADGACLLSAVLCGDIPADPLLLDSAGWDYHLLELETGRIAATIHHWDTIPCKAVTKFPLTPGAAYQAVQVVGTKIIPIPEAAFVAKARVYEMTMDPNHMIQYKAILR